MCCGGMHFCISIHALRGEGDPRRSGSRNHSPFISIHALRGEGDKENYEKLYIWVISIHALRGEGDRTCKGAREK